MGEDSLQYQSGSESDSENDNEIPALSDTQKRGLIIREQWGDLKSRLRSLALSMRQEDNSQLISFFTQADDKNTGALHIDDVTTILSTLNFDFLPDEVVDDLAEANGNFFDSEIYTDRFVILKGFGDFRGKVNYVKLYASLELDPPKDYLNPDQFFDPLPQPYRLIAKTLDAILDDAWVLLRERHPNLKELPVKNPELYGLGPPRKILDVKEASCARPSSCLDSYGIVTASEWSSNGNMLGCGTVSGHFVLLNPKSSAPIDGSSTSAMGAPGSNFGASAAMVRVALVHLPSDYSFNPAAADRNPHLRRTMIYIFLYF